MCLPCSIGVHYDETGLSSCEVSTLPSTLPAFSAINTDYAQQNTVDKEVFACAGYRLKFTQCGDGGSATGSTYLRLLDASGSQVTQGELTVSSSCGYRASFTHSFTEECQLYTLRQGCKVDESCSGTTAIVVEEALGAECTNSSTDTVCTACSPGT
jgi:hypothetical protein